MNTYMKPYMEVVHMDEADVIATSMGGFVEADKLTPGNGRQEESVIF